MLESFSRRQAVLRPLRQNAGNEVFNMWTSLIPILHWIGDITVAIFLENLTVVSSREYKFPSESIFYFY